MTLSEQSRQDMIALALSRYTAYGKGDEMAKRCVEIVVASMIVEVIEGTRNEPDNN